MTVYYRSIIIMSFRKHLPCLLSGGTTTGSDTGLGRLTPAVLYVQTLKKWVRPDCNLSMTWVVSLTKDIASVHNEDSVNRTYYSSPHFTNVLQHCSILDNNVPGRGIKSNKKPYRKPEITFHHRYSIGTFFQILSYLQWYVLITSMPVSIVY